MNVSACNTCVLFVLTIFFVFLFSDVSHAESDELRKAKSRYDASLYRLNRIKHLSEFDNKISWALQDQTDNSVIKYRDYLKKYQPFYSDDRITAAILNTFSQDNEQACALIREKKGRSKEDFELLQDRQIYNRLTRTIKSMEKDNDKSVVWDGFMVCYQDDGSYGDMIDVAGDIVGTLGKAGSVAGKIFSVLGVIDDLTYRYACSLRKGIEKCNITYFYTKDNKHFWKDENISINDKNSDKGIELSFFGGRSNLDYVAAVVTYNKKGKKEKVLCVWKIQPKSYDIVPMNGGYFVDKIFPTYNHKEK